MSAGAELVEGIGETVQTRDQEDSLVLILVVLGYSDALDVTQFGSNFDYG